MVASAYRRVCGQALAPHAWNPDSSCLNELCLLAALFPPAQAACVDPVHSNDAGPGDGYADDAWIHVGRRYRCDGDTHHDGDDGQCELPPSAALLRRLGPTGVQSLLPKLRSARLRNVLDPLSQAFGDVLVVFRTKFHPGRQGRLGIPMQLLARLTWAAPILRLHRIGPCGTQRVRLSLWVLCGIVLGRIALGWMVLRWIVLGWIVLRWIVLGRVVLRWVILGRMRLRGRPLLRGLGHVHRIGDGG